jgi:type VI secretion system protein ImpA
MIDSEVLLSPVSGENPCGEDIAYDPRFLELDTLLAGTPETQFSVAKEPDWKELRAACIELFARSKHLRVATLLCVALVKLDGAPGLRDGLSLLKGLLDRYWLELYPKLDPADDNDPLERINIVASLSTPLGTYGDPLRFLERLRQMPLSDSPRMGRFSMADLAGESPVPSEGEPRPPVSPEQFAAAMRDTPPDALAATCQAINESVATVQAIDAFLTETIGADNAPDMGTLLGALEETARTLQRHVSSESQGVAAVETSGGGVAAGAAGAAEGTGPIASRRGVRRALDQICDYYARHESSSPVPLLLKRARRMVDMDFMAIVNDMAPEAVGQISVITGTTDGGDVSLPADDATG